MRAKVVIAFLFVALASIGATSQASSKSGQITATALATRYYDTKVNCGSDSKPAFLCSGIVLRGTEYSAQYDSWNPSPTSLRVGGVSFSYLRSDYKVKRLAFNYTHGYVLMPILSTPAGKYHMQILCFFPVDGASDNRSEFGCGANTTYPADSRPCDRQGITTGEQWRDHFNKHPTDYAWRCGFDVRDATNNRAGPAFYQGMRGGRLVSPAAFDTPNDLKHAVWPQNIPTQLPIEAFIYVAPAGRSGAQQDQRRFYLLTNIALPIISVHLPITMSDSATFQYLPSDQLVPVP